MLFPFIKLILVRLDKCMWRQYADLTAGYERRAGKRNKRYKQQELYQ